MSKIKTNAIKTATAKTVASKTRTAKAAPAATVEKPRAMRMAAPAPAKAAEPILAPRPSKAPKAPKPPKLRQKPVRDSFTMPASDFALIATLKARLLAVKRETKKSELLRAGLHVLAALNPRALVATLGQLEAIKVGRPKKAH